MDAPQSFNKSSRILPWTREFSHGPVDPTGPSTPAGGSGLTVLNKNNGRRVAGNGKKCHSPSVLARHLAWAFVCFSFLEMSESKQNNRCTELNHRNVTTDSLRRKKRRHSAAQQRYVIHLFVKKCNGILSLESMLLRNTRCNGNYSS